MNIKPLHDRVVVKRDVLPTQTETGIHMPANDKKTQQKGTVVAVGPGMMENCAIQPMTVKEGDRVLLPYQKISPFEYGEENYEMMKEDDILGVIEAV